MPDAPDTLWTQFQLPRLRWRPGEHHPIVEPEICASCPDLHADFALLDQVVVPAHHELDEAAQRAQNSFRLVQLLVIVGGAVATCLGAVQTALGGGVLGIGLAEALVAGGLAGLTAYAGTRSLQKEYLSARLAAERLRGEYFLFLGRLAPYDSHDDEERLERLQQRVAAAEVDR